MPTIERDEVQIHWQIDGQADRPPMVLLNSLGSSTELWEPIMPMLLRHFRVLRIDKRGHGGSGATPGAYSLGMLADDVLAVMDAVQIEHAVLAGVSIGGMIAMQLAVQAPTRVDGLIISNSSAYVGPGRMDERIAAIREQGVAALADQVIERWFAADTIAAGGPFVTRVFECFRAVDPIGYVGCCQAIIDMDLRASLPSIACPALVIAGRDDASLPPENARFIADHLPDAQWLEMPAAHIPHGDLPGSYAQAMIDFALGHTAQQ